MRIVGLMSGTSVDGIDAALVDIDCAGEALNWRLLGFVCVPWRPELRELILRSCRPDAHLQTITALSYLLGEHFAAAAMDVAEAASVDLRTVDAIASHGQTVWHQPEPLDLGAGAAAGTMQIGEPAVIAARTGVPVVSDFRAADMAAGGQGAPLVPFADFVLLRSTTETRAVQNLGGIGNVTLLPRDCGLEDVLAFDTGPGCMVVDAIVSALTAGAQTYDEDGAIAARGTVCRPVLAELMQHPFFAAPPPKSTGREEFGARFADRMIALARKRGCSMEDTVATATALTAEAIGRAMRDWLLPRGAVDRMILGGGGSRNSALTRMIGGCVQPVPASTHADFGIPDDAKEALTFALLGYRTLHGLPSNVPAATGARSPAILGKIVLPAPARDIANIDLDRLLRTSHNS